jgi:anti-sigma regulatory factor (Ser/Thr protein kinase)
MRPLAQTELHSTGRAGRVGIVPCHELRVAAKPSEVWRVRHFADAVGRLFGLDAEQRHAFTFAVNEAASNAIEHGAPSPEGTIRLWSNEEDGELAFYVEDHGSFSPAAEDVSDRGRGLALIAAMIDQVTLTSRDGRTVVRLCKRLSA